MSTAPLSRCSSTLLFSNTEPLRNRPAGTTTRPPPAALAVSTAIALMRVTKTLHPPGGATALIAVIGGADIHRLGYWYVLLPCGAGACCMLLLALLTNNLGARRRYPQTWW